MGDDDLLAADGGQGWPLNCTPEYSEPSTASTMVPNIRCLLLRRRFSIDPGASATQCQTAWFGQALRLGPRQAIRGMLRSWSGRSSASRTTQGRLVGCLEAGTSAGEVT